MAARSRASLVSYGTTCELPSHRPARNMSRNRPRSTTGRPGSYGMSAGFVHGTGSPASTMRNVFDWPSGKSFQGMPPGPSNAVPGPTNTWQTVWCGGTSALLPLGGA